MKVKLSVSRCCCIDGPPEPPDPGYGICQSIGNPDYSASIPVFAAVSSPLSTDRPLPSPIGPLTSNWSEVYTTVTYANDPRNYYQTMGLKLNTSGVPGISASMQRSTTGPVTYLINGLAGSAIVPGPTVTNGDVMDIKILRTSNVNPSIDYLIELYYRGVLIKSQTGTNGNIPVDSDVFACGTSAACDRPGFTNQVIYYENFIGQFYY